MNKYVSPYSISKSSGILIVHQPTGLGVVSVSERSQFRNKERALVMLEILVELEEGQ